MSDHCILKEIWASYNLAFVFTDNPVQNILRKNKKQKKGKQKRKTLKSHLAYLISKISNISAGLTGEEAVSPCSFEISLLFPYFLRS